MRGALHHRHAYNSQGRFASPQATFLRVTETETETGGGGGGGGRGEGGREGERPQFPLQYIMVVYLLLISSTALCTQTSAKLSTHRSEVLERMGLTLQSSFLCRSRHLKMLRGHMCTLTTRCAHSLLFVPLSFTFITFCALVKHRSHCSKPSTCTDLYMRCMQTTSISVRLYVFSCRCSTAPSTTPDSLRRSDLISRLETSQSTRWTAT